MKKFIPNSRNGTSNPPRRLSSFWLKRQRAKSRKAISPISSFLKKTFSSGINKLIFTLLTLLITFVYTNYFYNPKVNLNVQVEVYDMRSVEPLAHMPVSVENYTNDLKTNENGVINFNIKCRKRDKILRLSAGGIGKYELGEKTIDIPLQKPRVFKTTFHLQNYKENFAY